MIQLKGKDYKTEKNTKCNYMLFTRTQLEQWYRKFENKRMEKICNADTNQKNINVFILISNKLYFKAKSITYK